MLLCSWHIYIYMCVCVCVCVCVYWKCGAHKCGLDSAAIGLSQRRGFVSTAVRKWFHRRGRFLDLSKYKFFRKILHRQYRFQCSRLQLVEQWLLFHNGYNQHVMMLSLTPNYKCIYIKSNINKPPSLSWKYRNQCTFGIRSYISYFRKEAAATIHVAKQKEVSCVGLFFIAGVCERNSLSLFHSSAVSSWDDLLIIRSSFIQSTVFCVVARFKYWVVTGNSKEHYVFTRPHFEGTFCLHCHTVYFGGIVCRHFHSSTFLATRLHERKYILTVITSAWSSSSFFHPEFGGSMLLPTVSTAKCQNPEYKNLNNAHLGNLEI